MSANAFQFQELFELQSDDTEYRKLTADYVRSDQFHGREVLCIERGRELYDHDADPRELTNLANVAEHAATIAQLSEQLHAAVTATFPADGQTPALSKQPGLWAPTLID